MTQNGHEGYSGGDGNAVKLDSVIAAQFSR